MSDGRTVRRLQWVTGIVFRLYAVAVVVAILASGWAWLTGDLAIFSGIIGLLWYGVAGFGSFLLVLLLLVNRRSESGF